jgi:hypothetical protein
MLQNRMRRKNKFGIPIERLLQTIGSGALGPSAFQGAKRTAAIGVFFHCFIAFAVPLSIAQSVARCRPLIDYPLFSGVVYSSAVHR